MSQAAIDILENEIEVLIKLSSNIMKKKSVIQKQGVDEIRVIDQEIKQLLNRAGVLDEHEALLKKKRDLNADINLMLADIDHKVEQANHIAIYLKSRIDAFKIELEKDGEEG